MAGLTCPHCGVATAFYPALITTLMSETVDGAMQVDVPAVMPPAAGRPGLAIVECQGCHQTFIARRDSQQREWQSMWPLGKPTRLPGVPDEIWHAYEEAQLCGAAGAFAGCLMMCRTAVTRLQRDQNVSRLRDLRDQGKISDMLYQQADEVRLWANVVGHEDYDLKSLTSHFCDELLAYVESLLDAIYVQPAKLSKVRAERQQRKSKTR